MRFEILKISNLMNVHKTTPDYIIEVSWEVCNKVGGIYTVLSTRAKTILTKTDAQLMFIGPDLWKETANPLFKEDKRLMAGWRKKATEEGLNIRIGRWMIPGEPDQRYQLEHRAHLHPAY